MKNQSTLKAKALTPHISSLNGELTPHISPLNGEQFVLSEGLTDELKNKIKNLKKRTSPQDIKNLIKELCDLRPLKLSEIAAVLNRDPKYVREKYLNDMVKNQELVHAFSDPNHPQQAYRTKK